MNLLEGLNLTDYSGNVYESTNCLEYASHLLEIRFYTTIKFKNEGFTTHI